MARKLPDRNPSFQRHWAVFLTAVVAGGWLIALSSFYTKIGNLAGGIPMEEKFAGGGDRPMQRRYWVNGGEKIRPLGSLVHTVLGPRVVNMSPRLRS